LGYRLQRRAAGKKNNLPVPACWADLLKPEFKGHIQMANPNSSGTAYTTLATMVQLLGEDEGFRVHESSCTSQHQPIHQVRLSPDQGRGSKGETTVGIVFMHDAVAQAASKAADVKVVAPCEGTGYEIGSMSHRQGRVATSGQLRKQVLRLGPERKDVQSTCQWTPSRIQVPSNKTARSISPLAPDLWTKIKLIDYDFAKKYGSSDERKRLLKKWDDDVSSTLPQ
jgi:iron(III) transport system substrate-binding protein